MGSARIWGQLMAENQGSMLESGRSNQNPPLSGPIRHCFPTFASTGERRDKTSDGRNGAAVDDEFRAVDRGGAMRGQVGDEIGHLVRFSCTPDRDPAQAI